MKHFVLISTLLISAICATAGFAPDKTDVSHKSPQAPSQQSALAEPKELYIVPNAGHVDLYDRVNLIPRDKLRSFFNQHLGR